MPQKGFISLHYRDFCLFLLARFFVLCTLQMLAVGLGQKVYEMTHSALHLGYIGLALFLPKLVFALIAGHAADRFDRTRIVFISRGVQALIAAGLVVLAHGGFQPLWLVYALLLLMATAHTFDGPASQAVVPQIVSKEHFNNAVSWNAAVFQFAFISGPAMAGWMYAVYGPMSIFYGVFVLRFLSFIFIGLMKRYPHEKPQHELTWKSLMAGVHYIFNHQVLLGIISLDLFAVLLGGAVALMPIFANDILHVGPTGLGFLRTAPSLGAALVGIALAHLPPIKQAGKTMLFCVALFGVFTILFGLSRSFYFSLFCLFALGAFDMVSVVIRGVLVQILTPPQMRGRVSAVNLVFIGASNELGEFESGLTASWFGTVPAVVLGGMGTLFIVLTWFWKFPQLKKFQPD